MTYNNITNEMRISSCFNDSNLKVVICGSGHGAHALAGIAASQPNTDVTVLTLSQNKAQRWNELLEKGQNLIVSLYQEGQKYSELKTKPMLVTHDPGKALLRCDVIVFVLTASAHEKYFQAIKPYLDPGMILVGLPGQAGFEFELKSKLGKLSNQITLINYESLPWVTRVNEFGRSCDVFGTKNNILGAMTIGATPPRKDPYAIMTELLGEKPVPTISGCLLTVSLMSTNAYLHTSILYDKWSSWAGQPLHHKSLFYHELSRDGASLMSRISDEVLAISAEISKKCRHVDMSQTIHMLDWVKRCYSSDITDAGTLHTAITTNRAYMSLTHPMTKTQDGKWVPDFTHRFLTEDVPYGLVVIRGIAEIAGVPTPNMDRVITWAQQIMNKKYLVHGKLQGVDVKETRAPQRYGFTRLSDLIGK